MKQELRTQILERRLGLDAGKVSTKSETIAALLRSLPEYVLARAIMFYLSFRQEVDTEPMIRAALVGGKMVAVPRTIRRERVLVPCRLEDYETGLVTGAYGIREPADCRPVPTGDLDMVIVPGVAFDRAGNRLGYGAGYYDRFLSSLGTCGGRRALAVGVAFALQVVDSLPAGPHDVPMDVIITEDGIVDCRGGGRSS